LIPAQVTGPAPGTVARISNAQSGSVKVSDVRAPGDGAVPSGFQSAVPARRIESCDSAAPVPLTKVKLDAPAASEGVAQATSSVAKTTLFMRLSINPSA